VQLNGDTEIDCRILDIESLLEAEQVENELREQLRPSEKYALAQMLDEEARKGPERRGRPKKGQNGREDNSHQPDGNYSGRHKAEDVRVVSGRDS